MPPIPTRPAATATSARRAQDDAQALAARLQLTEEDLADAERKAKAWMAKWEAEKQKDKKEE